LDEPSKHTCYANPSYTLDELITIRDYIRSFGRKFIIGDFKRCTHFVNAGTIAVDYVMFTGYKDWHNVDPFGSECWLPFEEDQCDSWTDMRNIFGGKFMSTWLNGETNPDHSDDYDGDEYSDLVGHATNLGLQEIWLYTWNGSSQSLLDSFTYFCWRNGWLRRFEHKIYIVFQCTCPDGCAGTPPGDCWMFVRTEPGDGTIREVYP
jgi:hypothetical protein